MFGLGLERSIGLLDTVGVAIAKEMDVDRSRSWGINALVSLSVCLALLGSLAGFIGFILVAGCLLTTIDVLVFALDMVTEAGLFSTKDEVWEMHDAVIIGVLLLELATLLYIDYLYIFGVFGVCLIHHGQC